MNIDWIFALIFYGLVILFFFYKREKFKVENKVFVMYRTKIGLKLMDSFAKSLPSLLKWLGFIGIAVGFAGMIFIFFLLFQSLFNIVINPASEPALAPVLPGIKIPGVPIYIPFWHGILSIFIIAAIHEFSHGVFGRLYNINVKSSGVAFLGPILAAFVEPDEKQLNKRKASAQFSILAAGPFSNILTAGVFLLILFAATPAVYSMLDINGAKIANVEKNYPLYSAGADVGEQLEAFNNIKVESVENFTAYMKNIKPGQKISLKTNKTTYNLVAVEHPKIKDKGYLGVAVAPVSINLKDETKKRFGSILPWVFFWFSGLFSWIFMLSLGIGLINLLPLGPVDGGKMFHLAALSITKDQKKTKKLWGIVSLISLALIVLNLTYPYFRDLILWLV